jgi:protein O-GlcNAc transferase
MKPASERRTAAPSVTIGQVLPGRRAARPTPAPAGDPADAAFKAGLAAHQAGRGQDAEAGYRRALGIDPDRVVAWNNLGMLLAAAQRHGEAEAAYREAIKRNPGYIQAWNNLGILLDKLKRRAEAEQVYREAIRLAPETAYSHINLGALYINSERFAEAETAYRRAIECDPGIAAAYNNLGIVLHRLHRTREAEAAFRHAYALQPGLGHALGKISYMKRAMADWAGLAEDDRETLRFIERGQPSNLPPFSLLSIPEATPAHLRDAARLRCEHLLPVEISRPPLATTIRPATGRPLRIGYLSADFHEHATSHLLAGVIDSHDASAFAIHLFSYGPSADDGARRRLQAACQGFHELSTLPDAAAARCIAGQEIDILVDLKGFTRNSRAGISALRPAPIIVNWLGYPGSLGHPRLADYLIGDPVVSPLQYAAHYSETLALMPHCYQPNDRARVIGPTPTRAEAGLPETGFVFCSFNQTYKLNPEMFDPWCRLLAAVPGSVLWLLQPKAPVAVDNLRREAAARGIDPARLVFAANRPQAEHLGRLRLADLALDTFPVTSHTTGSDALWAGVPLVTKLGPAFVSRVAASLLHGVGLPELVAADDADYVAKALDLARHPEKLAELRARLDRQRLTAPLFDTLRFTRDLERLYRAIWAQAVAGTRQPIVLPAEVRKATKLYGKLDTSMARMIDSVAEGKALFKQATAEANAGRLKNAEALYLRLIALRPRAAGAYNNLANLYSRMGRVEEAMQAYGKTLEIQPHHGHALSQFVHLRQMLAIWPDLHTLSRTLLGLLDTHQTKSSLTPFALLGLPESTPEQLRLSGMRYVQSYFAAQLDTPARMTEVKPAAGRALNIGYLSADLQEHATTHLLAGVIDSHDATACAVHLFSYGQVKDDAYRQRLRASGAKFHDLAQLSDQAAAECIAGQDIDILVDLKGFTRNSRAGISALRPAPIIVNWLGYPGSLGHPRLADYLIGDPVVSPLKHAAHYSETLALMPHCYQPNDRARVIGPTPTRAEAGLPETGFVFCSFNQTYKLNPEMFDLWCRLLVAVPGSVLWLLQPKAPVAVANLRREAAARGIDPARLVFAANRPQAEHLGRLRLADLALDTFPVTSHTTGSDALWAGVPLVTKLGPAFVSRVAASLLHGVGLPELVAADDAGYFDLALDLARHPDKLTELRARLDRQRLTAPLFDTARFTRDLERLYQAIWVQAVQGTRQPIVLG